MKKLLKFLKWTAIVLFGMPVLVYLVWLTGNIKNDELNPELAKLLAHRPSEMNEKDNAYFDTLGLNAPPDMEPHAWGVSWFAQASAIDRALLQNQPATPINLAGYPLKSKRIELPCSRKDSQHTCLEEIALNPSAAQKHLEDEALLLHRFDALLDKEYQEPYRELSYESEIDLINNRASRLAQIRIALEIARGRDASALAKWKNETIFNLRQARNSHTMNNKMVLVNALNRYQKLLAEYISLHPKAARSQAKQLLAMLEPFDRSAVTLQPAYESEAVYWAKVQLSRHILLSSSKIFGNLTENNYSITERVVDTLAMPLYDPQATANETTRELLECAQVAALEGEDHRAGIAKIEEQRSNDMIDWTRYHNPIGHLLSLANTPYYSPYLFKSDDIIANKKLLAFAIDLLSRNATSSKQIAEAIKQKHADLKHPYTGEAPVWDDKKRTLSYVFGEQTKTPSGYVPLAIKL